MHNLTTNKKIFLLSYAIISIPFLEFFNSNKNNIDIYIFNHLVFFYILVFVFILLINFFLLKFSSKAQIYIISLSFFFWLLFRFKIIKDFLGGDGFKLSAELSLIILLSFFCFFFFFILKEKIFQKFYKFLFLFFIFQNIFLIIFISSSLLRFDQSKFLNNENYQKYKNHINKEREYFSKDELSFIKNNTNKNIYFFIFDGMTSLEMLKKWNPKKNIDIETIKKSFLDKKYVYIENSLSSYNFTPTSFASMLQMQPLFEYTKNGMTKLDKIYKEQLFPKNLSSKNFKNNNHPNLIYNLYKIDYKFIWLGSQTGCDIYNPKLCIDFDETVKTKDSKIINEIKIKGPKINWYILDVFLENTPLTQIFNVISDILFEDKKISKNDNKFDFTNEFIENFHHNKQTYSKQNYFYLVHNSFPLWDHVFDGDCSGWTNKIVNGMKEYINNYNCALKTIDKLIIFFEKKDPNAIVIFQADNGIYFDKKNGKFNHLPEDKLKSKIFNLIKVPNYCKNELNNHIDNINSVRLALSCATNTKPKLLERKTFKPL